jgi:hypothetical protein
VKLNPVLPGQRGIQQQQQQAFHQQIEILCNEETGQTYI